MLLPRSCLRFPGVLLLVSHDTVKLPPSLRRCLPQQLVGHHTSIVPLFVLRGMSSPTVLLVWAVVTGVIVPSRL